MDVWMYGCMIGWICELLAGASRCWMPGGRGFDGWLDGSRWLLAGCLAGWPPLAGSLARGWLVAGSPRRALWLPCMARWMAGRPDGWMDVWKSRDGWMGGIVG